MPVCNTTAGHIYTTEPIAGNLTVHQIGVIICGVFAVITTGIAVYLMQRHALNYTRPDEQRHVLRIILMLPIYSIITTLSYQWYYWAIYFEVIRDCYEAFALASFFFLMTFYISPTLRSQKFFFRRWQPPPWPWPATWLTKIHPKAFPAPRSGLTWFNIIWTSTLQYCLIRVLLTFTALITQYFGAYCEESWHPGFAHLWVVIIMCLMITVALYALASFYTALKEQLDPYRPFLKFLSIKLVIFFSFWQGLLIDWLIGRGWLHTGNGGRYISEADLHTGINAVLISIEMTGFAVMHLYAYPWGDYTSPGLAKRYSVLGQQGVHALDVMTKGGSWGWKAYADTFNPWDMVKATARGIRWLFVRRKNRHVDSIYTDEKQGRYQFGTGEEDEDDNEKLLSRTAYNPHSSLDMKDAETIPLDEDDDVSYPRQPEIAMYDPIKSGIYNSR